MFSQRGQGGELRAGPCVAARFAGWVLTREDDVLASDVATVEVESLVIVDTYHARHSTLDLWLDCERAWWVFRGVRAHESSWVTRGGPPEIRVK